jgi:hypothetical protein
MDPGFSDNKERFDLFSAFLKVPHTVGSVFPQLNESAQFLEHLLPITKLIVRMGSMSKSEKLDSFRPKRYNCVSKRVALYFMKRNAVLENPINEAGLKDLLFERNFLDEESSTTLGQFDWQSRVTALIIVSDIVFCRQASIVICHCSRII